MQQEFITRRDALALTAASGAAFGLSPILRARQQPTTTPVPAKPGASPDRDFVVAAGLTPAEADCWEAIARAAGAFFALPELHTMDKQEVASAIHIVQNKLLSRPTYRRYLELAKAGHEKHEQ